MTELADRTVILILQELAEDLQRPAAALEVTSEDEARLVLRALLDGYADGDARTAQDALPLPRSAAEAIGAGRRLLAAAQRDEDAGPVARALTQDPPADDQLSVEAAAVVVVVLAAMIAFLQTKVSIKIQRDADGTKVEFELLKRASSDSLLRTLARLMADILRGSGGQGPGPI
ncbi:hypothetical protein ACIBO5_52810 [Nonomuraea angiospora]|uniref:hypothetical protein n=1 Tax=Nonomuraea angiospora TaxID=46172 RepID=UPI00379B146C